MKQLLVRLARWVLGRYEPVPDGPRAPTLYAVVSRSGLHGTPGTLIESGVEAFAMKLVAMDYAKDQPTGSHYVVRVVRYEPVSEWDPKDWP